MEHPTFEELNFGRLEPTSKWVWLIIAIVVLLLAGLAFAYKTYFVDADVLLTGGEYSSHRYYCKVSEKHPKSGYMTDDTVTLPWQITGNLRIQTPALENDGNKYPDRDKNDLKTLLKKSLEKEGIHEGHIMVNNIEISTPDWRPFLTEAQISFDIYVYGIISETVYEGTYKGGLKYKAYSIAAARRIKEEAFNKISGIIIEIVKKDLKTAEDSLSDPSEKTDQDQNLKPLF